MENQSGRWSTLWLQLLSTGRTINDGRVAKEVVVSLIGGIFASSKGSPACRARIHKQARVGRSEALRLPSRSDQMDERKAQAPEGVRTDGGKLSIFSRNRKSQESSSYIIRLHQHVNAFCMNKFVFLFLSSRLRHWPLRSLTTLLVVDWTYRQHYHSRLLDPTGQLRRVSPAVPFAVVRPSDGRTDLRRSAYPVVLHQHRVSLRVLLQQRSPAQGYSTSNGPRNDLRVHSRLVFSLVEPRPHAASLHRLCA